ncbi:histidine kinase famiy protein [Methylobacterium isbiliense]|jgi:PAS domain S-box-containing protein|uniref:histidine kinase n=1 Tax=Methylobacterium isbiliense TaxID=315478 RepID=A0ABQ4SH69_9HYPH|nr:histidine kinase famiy protein [Methylobacterium isbiliense]MDN3624114.1 histidine kinase famiy protein [Methylobacterium isbiliense]GJE01840.1 Blue-light-activated protein [Methylobacterium isbiliense]
MTTPDTPPAGPGPIAARGLAGEASDHRGDIFFSAVETARMPMVVTDPHQPDNPIIFANQAFRRMTGYEPGDLIGRNCRFLQGPETDLQTVDEVRRAIRERREIATEILNYRKNGSSFWNALFISPVYDPAGDLVYFFGSQIDVSRRRDAEDALRQSQRMEALGHLTGGIAHDFNNLLQVVVGYADILQAGLADPGADPGRLVRAAETIRGAAERAATLTQQLLAFSRKQGLEGRAVNLNNLVEGMGDLAGRILGAPITVATVLNPTLRNARLDPTQTEVALLNLLINAREAMPAGGRVTITTENHDVAQDDAGPRPLPPGRYVAITVADEGTGMPPEVLARVTEPFFTTREEGRGAGLAMVQGFVRQSGGSLEIASEVGRGTSVRLIFPAGEADERPAGASRRRGVERSGTETILIVDDHGDVAALARTILQDFGYTILAAAEGREALEILDGGRPVDLLFSDLTLPGGMTGVVLAREARRRQPRLKVLLTSGDAGTSLERTGAGGSEFELIDKPYRRLDLVRRIRAILDGPTGVD